VNFIFRSTFSVYKKRKCAAVFNVGLGLKFTIHTHTQRERDRETEHTKRLLRHTRETVMSTFIRHRGRTQIKSTGHTNRHIKQKKAKKTQMYSKKYKK